MNSKNVGDISLSFVIAGCVQKSQPVSIPCGDNQRYDLVVESAPNKFSRVQVKTARLQNNGERLAFETCSSYCHRGGKKHGYAGDVDVPGAIQHHGVGWTAVLGEGPVDAGAAQKGRPDQGGAGRIQHTEKSGRWAIGLTYGQPNRRRAPVNACRVGRPTWIAFTIGKSGEVVSPAT